MTQKDVSGMKLSDLQLPYDIEMRIALRVHNKRGRLPTCFTPARREIARKVALRATVAEGIALLKRWKKSHASEKHLPNSIYIFRARLQELHLLDP